MKVKWRPPPSLSRRWNVLRHEPMAFFEGAVGLGRASPDWLARQTTDGVASDAHQAKLAGRGVCVSRRGRNRPEDAGKACQADRPFSRGLAVISIVLSQNSPYPSSGEPSKTKSFAQPGPTLIRQNDANCLVGGAVPQLRGTKVLQHIQSSGQVCWHKNLHKERVK